MRGQRAFQGGSGRHWKSRTTTRDKTRNPFENTDKAAQSLARLTCFKMYTQAIRASGPKAHSPAISQEHQTPRAGLFLLDGSRSIISRGPGLRGTQRTLGISPIHSSRRLPSCKASRSWRSSRLHANLGKTFSSFQSAWGGKFHALPFVPGEAQAEIIRTPLRHVKANLRYYHYQIHRSACPSCIHHNTRMTRLCTSGRLCHCWDVQRLMA